MLCNLGNLRICNANETLSSSSTLLSLQEDYMHLLRVLSTRYFKMKKITGEKGWEVTNAMKQTVIDQVSQLMARCSVYCKESDSELGLMCAAD